MAWFRNEETSGTGSQIWNRAATLAGSGKTVEVYVRTIDGKKKYFLRVWTSKRGDGSNKVHADPDLEY